MLGELATTQDRLKACPTSRPCRKQYSPRRHGDTEKNKVKGKTGAQGGGGGHGAVKSPRSEESSLRAKISAASNTKGHSAFRCGACFSLPKRVELARRQPHHTLTRRTRRGRAAARRPLRLPNPDR